VEGEADGPADLGARLSDGADDGPRVAAPDADGAVAAFGDEEGARRTLRAFREQSGAASADEVNWPSAQAPRMPIVRAFRLRSVFIFILLLEAGSSRCGRHALRVSIAAALPPPGGEKI